MGSADRHPLAEPREVDWLDVLNESGSDIAVNKLVVPVGAEGPIVKVGLATANNYAAGMFVARAPIPNGRRGLVVPWRHLTNVDTSGASVGDPVYLGSSGAWALYGSIVIGVVTSVSATTGSVMLLPQGVAGGGGGGTSVAPFYLDIFACNVDTTDSSLSPARATSLVSGPYIEISATTVTSNGIVWPIPQTNVSSIEVLYTCGANPVDTIDFKLYEVTRGSTASVVAGSADSHYDAAHDTNAERIASGTHDLTLTPPTAVTRDPDKYLMLVMTLTDGDSGNSEIDVYSIRVNP